MGSVRLRVVSGQAAAVPRVHATPWVFLVVVVATLGALAWEFEPQKCWGARLPVGRGHCRPIVALDFTVLAEPGGCGWVARCAACDTDTLDNVTYNRLGARVRKKSFPRWVSALHCAAWVPPLDNQEPRPAYLWRAVIPGGELDGRAQGGRELARPGRTE